MYLLRTLNCCKQPGDVNPRPHLAPAGVQVVAVGGEEQVGEASVVAGGQQGQQGAVLAGVKAGAAGVRAAGIHGHAGAEAEAGDDAALALLLHCSREERARVWPGGRVNFQSHAFLITSLKGKKNIFLRNGISSNSGRLLLLRSQSFCQIHALFTSKGNTGAHVWRKEADFRVLAESTQNRVCD